MLDGQGTRQNGFRLAFPGDVIVDATHDSWRTLFAYVMFNVRSVIPVHRVNTVVQFLFYVFLQQICDVNDAQELFSRLRMYPQVDAEQAVDCNFAAGFFQ